MEVRRFPHICIGEASPEKWNFIWIPGFSRVTLGVAGCRPIENRRRADLLPISSSRPAWAGSWRQKFCCFSFGWASWLVHRDRFFLFRRRFWGVGVAFAVSMGFRSCSFVWFWPITSQAARCWLLVSPAWSTKKQQRQALERTATTTTAVQVDFSCYGRLFAQGVQAFTQGIFGCISENSCISRFSWTSSASSGLAAISVQTPPVRPGSSCRQVLLNLVISLVVKAIITLNYIILLRTDIPGRCGPSRSVVFYICIFAFGIIFRIAHFLSYFFAGNAVEQEF